MATRDEKAAAHMAIADEIGDVQAAVRNLQRVVGGIPVEYQTEVDAAMKMLSAASDKLSSVEPE